MAKGQSHRARKPGGSGGTGASASASGSGHVRTIASSRRAATKGKGGERVTRSSKAKLTNGLEDPAQVEKDLSTQLRSMGLYAANTMGDGNCLFRALSDQLYGYPHQHSVLREQVCDYLASKPEKFAAFIDIEKPFEEYVRSMRQNGTYGGHLELSAFAQLQQKEIKIVQPGLVYIVSGDDESPQAIREREKRERTRQIAQSKTQPGSEGPPPSERELRRLRRERKVQGPDGKAWASPKPGESSRAAVNDEEEGEVVEEREEDPAAKSSKSAPNDSAVEAYGPLYIAYHNWEHYSSIRNMEGPHTGLPRIKEISASQGKVLTTVADEEAAMEATEPTEEEALVLRSTSGYSLQQIRFYIKRHGGWEEALEAILAQAAVDDDETEDEDIMSHKTIISVTSSPDDAARADAAAGPSQPRDASSPLGMADEDREYYGHLPFPGHLRDWRAASPSSVDTVGTHSSMEGGSASTHATTDESPESGSLHHHPAKGAFDPVKRSKRAASKDPTQTLRSPKRRSRSRSPMQPVTPQDGIDAGTLAAAELDHLHVRGTPVEGEPMTREPTREASKLRTSTTKVMTMRERRVARQEEKAKRAIEAKNRRRERALGASGATEEGEMREPASHVRGFLELKI